MIRAKPHTLDDAFAAMAPSSTEGSAAWFRRNVYSDEGRLWDWRAYPHITAPGGPCDALDDPSIRYIWMQWGVRLGKSFFGQAALEYYGAVRPCPMMHCAPTETLAKQIAARTTRMIERSPALRDQLPAEHRRKQNQIELANCRVWVAWSRSPSTLADKSVRVGHGAEVDKWEHSSTSREGDPLKLFFDRALEFPLAKLIAEGTPTIKHHSRIERGVAGSTNCRLYVPCPTCNGYQQLRRGDGERPGGVVWDRTKAGKSDKDLAFATARYVCALCEAEIKSHERPALLRAGVWAPEGSTVVDGDAARAAASDWQAGRGSWAGWERAGWISGTPVRDGREAGYQLSGLYATARDWGDLASEWVAAQGNQGSLRAVINQTLAETWEIAQHRENWETIGERLVRPVAENIVPAGFSLVTAGVDKQATHYVYEIVAWARGRRSHTVTYGTAETLVELESVLKRRYESQAGGPAYPVKIAVIDSGYRPKGVAEFCRERQKRAPFCFPCKGSSSALDAPFKFSTQSKRSALPGQRLILVDTTTTQDWVEHSLHEIKPGDEGSFSLFSAPLEEHQDYLEQLLNEAPLEHLRQSGSLSVVWERIDPSVPNDYRDCRRYAYVGMIIATKGGEIGPARRVVRRGQKPPADRMAFADQPAGYNPWR